MSNSNACSYLFKFPDRKFIIDVASGILIYIFCLQLFYWINPTIIDRLLNMPNKHLFFLEFMLILLANPMGAVLSANSWFTLGGLTTRLYVYMFSSIFKPNSIYYKLVKLINSKNYIRYQFQNYSSFFGMDENNWQNFYHGLNRLFKLSQKAKEKVNLNLDSVTNGITFLRNLSILFVLLVFFSFVTQHFAISIVYFILFTFTILLGVVEENYAINNIFHCTYLFLIDKFNDGEISGDFRKIQQKLIE